MLSLSLIRSGPTIPFPILPTSENLNTYLKQRGMRLAINLLPDHARLGNQTIRLWTSFRNFLMLWGLTIIWEKGNLPGDKICPRLSYLLTKHGFCKAGYLHIPGLRISCVWRTQKISISYRQPIGQRIFPQRYARKLMSFTFSSNGSPKISKLFGSGAAKKSPKPFATSPSIMWCVMRLTLANLKYGLARKCGIAHLNRRTKKMSDTLKGQMRIVPVDLAPIDGLMQAQF